MNSAERCLASRSKGSEASRVAQTVDLLPAPCPTPPFASPLTAAVDQLVEELHKLLDRQLVQDGLDGARHGALVVLLPGGLARLLLRGPRVFGGLQLLGAALAHRPPLRRLQVPGALRARGQGGLGVPARGDVRQ